MNKYKINYSILTFAFFTFINTVYAASSSEIELKAIYDISNKASLQRGAKYFVNYCMGCHSIKYMRYSRLSEDLNLNEDLITKNLMFTRQKFGETMSIAMNPEDAERWFGAKPPDLSLIARSKGADYIFTFLNTFYLDESKPHGYNNLAYPNTSMPHALVSLQGSQKNVLNEETGKHERFIQIKEGIYTKEKYEKATNDITAFLVYVSEPAKLQRHAIGFWVLLFIFAFTIVAYYTKKEFWKDVK
ncbi:MAG: cytochrome c1 [Gammaproteobacteria bacterium]|nr:cytochrome c1 [Gammaproteobacteria bacterium]|tara:strand:+ start:624 stop:1358 length:735 start_codon:yes stop_codon:yes gene_type:complete